MKRIILSLAAVAAVALSAAAQEFKEAYPSYIQVTGRAEKEIVPDLFYLSITVNEKDSKGKLSVESQQRDMIAALQRLGVDTEQKLTVANRSSEYYKRSTALASARYQLELGSAAMVDRVLSVLSDLGISNVFISRVSHTDIDRLKEEVRIAAVKNAQSTAVSIAEALGQKAADCFYIYDANVDVVPAYYNNSVMTRGVAESVMLDFAADSDSDSPEFKTIRLNYSVQAKFILRGSRGNVLPMN